MSYHQEYWGCPPNDKPQPHPPKHHKPRPPFPPHHEKCPQQPGTLLRIFIPPGAVVNLANIIEISSPAGVCLIVRLPFLGANNNGKKHNFDFHQIVDAVKAAGGTVEFD